MRRVLQVLAAPDSAPRCVALLFSMGSGVLTRDMRFGALLRHIHIAFTRHGVLYHTLL